MNIIYYNNIKLRQPNCKVSEVDNSIIKQMFNLMKQHNGVGLAAPQVGINQQFFIYNYMNEQNVIINPIILEVKGLNIDIEGCLSIPKIIGVVPRYTTITIEYFDINNKKHVKTINNYLARIFQHEIDHLNGILFIDKTDILNYEK